MNELMTQTTMTSLEVAEITGKRHDHVLRDIEDESAAIAGICNAPIFGLVDYIDQKGEKRKMYHLSQEGVMQLGARYDAVIRYKLIARLQAVKHEANKHALLPAAAQALVDCMAVYPHKKISEITLQDLVGLDAKLQQGLR